MNNLSNFIEAVIPYIMIPILLGFGIASLYNGLKGIIHGKMHLVLARSVPEVNKFKSLFWSFIYISIGLFLLILGFIILINIFSSS